MLKNKFLNYVVNRRKEKFDYIYDWTTPDDIKKRKEEINISCPPIQDDSSEESNIIEIKEKNNENKDEDNNIKEEDIDDENEIANKGNEYDKGNYSRIY